MANQNNQSPDDDQRFLERTFAELVALHGPQIVKYIQRRRYPILAADVNDIAEEVFIVVWRRMKDLPQDAALPWMLGIARNVLNNAKRSQRRRSEYEAGAWPSSFESSAEEEIVASESIREALAQLKPRDREILILHYWDGLNTQELAQALALSSHNAAVRLSRAGQRFQENLEGLEKE